MRMRTFFFKSCLLLILLGNIAQDVAQQKKCDSHCVRTVRVLVKDRTFRASGFGEKINRRLGDNVSIALFKIYKMKELLKPENIRLFLPVVHDSFISPELISSADARAPIATLFLLRRLEQEVSDSDLKKEISETIFFILESSRDKRE